MEVSDQLHVSAKLPPGKHSPLPVTEERARAGLDATGNRTPAVQPVTRRYTE
jgi:hypothetical protein